MKRIRIVLILVCGLMTPFIVRSGIAIADLAGDAAKGVDSALSDALEAVTQASKDILSAVSDRIEGADEVVATFTGKAQKSLEDIQGAFKAKKMTAEEAQSAIEAIGKSVKEDAESMTEEATNKARTSDWLEGRIGNAGDTVTQLSERALKKAGLSEKEIKQFDAEAAADDAQDRQYGAGRYSRPAKTSPQPNPEGVAEGDASKVKTAVDTLGAETDQLATRLERTGDKAANPEDRIDSGVESGAGDVSLEKEEAEYAKEPEELGFFARRKGRLADIKRLSSDIDNASSSLSDLEKQVVNERIILKDAHGDDPASVEIPGSGFSIGSKSEDQVAALKDFLKNNKAGNVDPADIEIAKSTEKSMIFDDKEVITVKITLRGTAGKADEVLEFKLEKPSSVEEKLVTGASKKGFSLGSDGRLSFKSDDTGIVNQCKAGIDSRINEIQKLKENITGLVKRRSERENIVNTTERFFKDSAKSIKAALKDPKKTLNAAGRGIIKGAKFTGRTIKTVGKKVVNGVLEVVKMMMTGVFFGVPSMIYQTLMQQAAAKALYEQITSVYHITPNFAVQIPASLISPSNAAQAGTYLYVAVDPSTSGYGNDMSSAFLENASYYVVYPGPGQEWGSTYITSSQNPNPGVLACINNAAVFIDGGVPYSEQTPFAYLMEPSNDSTIQAVKGAQTTLSVQSYTQQAFDAVGNRANYSYSEGFMDSIAPWNIATQSYDHSVTPNSTLQMMFAPVESSVTHAKEKMQKPSRYAPKVLVRTLNIFRNGIQNVPGFLPGSQVKPPTISIKQFEGTGILNRLLGSQSSPDAIAQSMQLITTLSSTMSPGSSNVSSSAKPATQTNVVQAVVDAQAQLKQALSDASSINYGNAVEAASAALKNARANLQAAISVHGAGTNLGMDPSLDVNAYNIYLYQTQQTDIVTFMEQNRFSDLIPVSDYILFLDTNLNIVPLFSTAVITRPDGVGVLDFDTSQINSNINYMVSLVTGVIYLYNASGSGTVVPSLNNMPAAQYVASTVLPNLFQQIALVLSVADANDLINQILTMANYATNLSYQGPVVKNGCLFEKIPLELSAQDAAAIKQNTLDDALNGVTIPAQPVVHKTSFGPSASASITQSQLDSMYVYKVSKRVPGSKEQVGVFGTSAEGQPLYDYIVPVAPVTNADGTSGLQMMPLGIAEAVGFASGMSGVQMMVSLVTGQVYDNNYCLSSGVAQSVIERNADFSPIAALPGQDSMDWGQKDGQGNEIYVAVVKNLPLATAFMPTFCNPFNITYGSLFTNPDYQADTAALSTAQIAVQNALNVIAGDIGKAENPTYVQDIWAYIKSNPNPKVLNEIFNSKEYAPKLGITGEPAGALQADIQAWMAASAALIPLQNALRLKVQALQSVLQPPYNPVKKATDQMLIMCPMYWMHYVKFAGAAQSTNAQTISYTNPSQQPVTTSINWINTSASTAANPLGCSLGQALPITNVLDVIHAYEGWQENMNSTSGVAKVMQSGPFQFSKNEKYNVYLTLPASNGPLDLSTGNFFYNMVPVASPTSLFVLGNLDANIAQSINNSLSQNSTTGLTSPLTIDQCNTSNKLGSSYLDLLQETPVAIDISTGDVWLPTSVGYSVSCYNTAQGNIANAQCNVFKIGSLNPEEVLDLALKNQGTTKSQVQIDNPGLYATLMNCQELALQKAQLAFTAYFAGSLLSLCQEQITNKTYIYAVNVAPENYYEATDYWVATDAHSNPQGILTPQTQFMVSLVTGNVYEMNYSSNQQTAQPVQQAFAAGTGVATIDTPKTIFQQMFGVGSQAVSSTLLTPVASNNPKLFNIIESLNNIQNQDFLESQFSSSANTTVLGGQIPLTALQTATPVSALYSTLYLVNGKYYLAMPGTGGAPTYYYDFNAEVQDVNTSSGTAVYTPVKGDAQRGMYYLVEGTGSTAIATPAFALTGYGCQAMRMRFGIQVAADGTETMGLPVYNPPLPMATNDKTLKPGASGDNMKCLTSAANVASNAAVTDTYTYYQYKNVASESYLTRCFLNTKVPVYNQATQAVSSLPEYQDYYVDLVTGECYSPDGTPRLSNITVAYNFSGNASTGIVANSALDFSNPLFVWGELDLLGESLQAYMMYQDTNTDPVNGYNQYQVQPFSTSFTLYNGGTPTVYAYATDASGHIQITQNGNPMTPAQTSMSSVLVSALNSGSSLATKSYTMNVNGVVPSGTPGAGAAVTVTETFVAPKQYMISYTNAAGSLITDMFQTPVMSGPGTAPGASINTYNNPPLDASLQAQLLQGKPFCARVFASCPYGQETVQNSNTTNLGTTGVTCGLLYQPATAANFTLPSAGLLSAIFSGANPNGSTGAMNGQYFAFYDSYNNGSGTSSNVVPSKGNYGTYTSVVSSMSVNNLVAPYPGLYAGNFNVEFASSAGSTQTTYGAPYLRIMGLTGTLGDTSTNYTVPPTSGTEYLYKYQYDIVPNALLAQLKATLNISGNVAGFMQLVSALDYGSLAGVSASNASVNQAAAAVITNQVFYGTPLNALTQEPKGRYLYKLACASGGADADSTAPTNGLCQMFYTPGATNPDTYIDMYNGIVFQSKTTADEKQLLYPIGFSVSHDQRNALSKMVGGAVPTQGSTALTISTPVVSTAVTTTNPKGLPVGQGAPLPGQIVNGAITPVAQAAPAA